MKVPQIDLESLTCSALLVEPKPPFFEWLSEVLPTRAEEVYFPEEDPVWLIPPVPRFGSGEDLNLYLESLKPKLLEFTLGAFVTDIALLPQTIDAATFDRFFELKFRDSVKDIGILESPHLE
jgi:hypothetical protein